MTDDDVSVLVVDDEPGIADLYVAWLAERFDAEAVYDGTAALDALDEHVDVVLLDRRMPDRSGDDVLDEIRDRGLDCQVAMVTAVHPDFDVLEMGFDEYLTKPVSQDDLLGLVDRLRRRREYDATMDELCSLLARRTALESAKTQSELDVNEDYQRLLDRIDALSADADALLEDLTVEDAEALFHRLADDREGRER